MSKRNSMTNGFKKLIHIESRKMILKIVILIPLVVLFATCSFAQAAADTTDKRFHDDLLDHMVGKWDVSAIVYEEKFTLDREVEWVLDHQYLRIHEKSREIIPWLKIPFERTIFIGYNHLSKRYIVYELTVHGGDGPFQPEGFSYGDRTGNELKMALTKGSEVLINQRFTWDPESGSWRFQGRKVVDGKEQEPHVDQRATRVKASK